MTIFAARYARIAFPLGVLLSVFQLVLSVILIGRGETTWVWWINLIAAVYMFGWFGRLSYLTVFVPVVRINDREIRWRAMVGTRFQQVNLDDVVGHRFQDTFDLRLRLRTGGERSIHLSQIAKRDWPRLVATIQEIIGERTAAI